MALKIPPSTFSAAEITALMRAGFLTSSVQGLNSTHVFAGPDSGPTGNLTSISTIAKAASGSMAAIGGEGAIYGAGGRGGIRRSSSQLERSSEQQSSEAFGEGVELRLSLPGTGAFLKVRRLFVLIYNPFLVARHFPGVLLLFRLRYHFKTCLVIQFVF